MRMTAWVAFFLVSNVLGVAAFRAAMTLPFGVTCRVIADNHPRLVFEESAVE